MSKVDVFDIRLDSDQAVYREGDKIGGVVHIENEEELKVKSIRIDVCGVAVVRWDSDGSEFEADPDDKIKGDADREVYFNKRITFLERGEQGYSWLLDGILDKDPVLPSGNHEYHFDCKLPPELPSSFEGGNGQIRYLAKATIERPKKPHLVTKKAFTVLSGLDLNFIPEAASKIELCKHKETGGLCCSTGSVTVDWTVEQSGFVPGEDILISGAVQNDSRETISCSKATLFMVIEYKSRKRRRREKRALASIDKPETAPGDVTIWQEALHIPPLPPTGLSRCELIDVGYELQFMATFEGKVNPIVFNKDIYIGTVPMCRREMKSCIAGMFNQPYYDSQEFLDISMAKAASAISLTQIIAAASKAEPRTGPSAPCLDSVERLDHDEATTASFMDPGVERPPPFAPGHMEATERERLIANPAEPPLAVSPTAPGPNTIYRGEGIQTAAALYPTLASSWFEPVNLRDQVEDGDAVQQGETTFNPVYPYYNAGGQENIGSSET